ncbi:MAG: NAD-dependent epimerase/dehydratase family protein [Pseudomonadota bacterium]
MKVLLSGASGFVGRHVAAALLDAGHDLALVGRDPGRLSPALAAAGVPFHRCDLHAEDEVASLLERLPMPDVFMHFAWPAVGNVMAPEHLTRTLPAELRLADRLVDWGVGHLLVSGTCLEYGMQSGPLGEGSQTLPSTPYGIAKDCLRKALEVLQARRPITLQWLRLFYLHGEGQPPRSLLPQLECAIASGDAVFPMSRGDQLRDYMAVEEVATEAAALIGRPEIDGVINCCSGTAIAVVDLVRRIIEEQGASIDLDRGHYPYPSYEPLAFWGVPGKILALRGEKRSDAT